MAVNPRSSADSSFANALVPIPERRASARIRTVCFDVRLNRGGYVGLYRARNISDTGMMLSTHARFEAGERVLIELSEPFAIEGTILWSDEKRCGIKFATPIDCAILLRAQAERKQQDRRGGALRLATASRATSYAENGIRAVKVTNVSHRGMGLVHDGSLEAGMMLKVAVESGVERCGAVRWSHDGRAGIRLLEALSCEELALICNHDRRAAPADECQGELLFAD
jgi:hypothetical protein